MNCSQISIADSQVMTTFAFDNMSNESSQNTSKCIFTQHTDPKVVSGVILTFLGIFLGLVIIFIKKLHSTTIQNISFVAITLIVMIIGVGLLNFPASWYEMIISVTMDTTLASLAILLGVKLQVQEKQLEIILFSLWCAFGGIGLILLIIGAALSNYVVLGIAWICWYCVMLIVIVYTAYYLDRCSKEQFCDMYVFFLWSYEYVLLFVCSQISLNSFIDCRSSDGKNLTETMIRHDEKILFH